MSTISGQLFGVAVVYLAMAHRDSAESGRNRTKLYVVLTLVSLAAVQLLCRAQAPAAASLSIALVACGMIVAALLGLSFVVGGVRKLLSSRQSTGDDAEVQMSGRRSPTSPNPLRHRPPNAPRACGPERG